MEVERDNCPLCRYTGIDTFYRDKKREYLRCQQCQLVFVPPKYHLSQEEEMAEYSLHQNSPDDARYRNFLSRLYRPLLARLSAGASGLDFGCGPGPTLSVMFTEQGFPTVIYDKYFYRDHSVFEKTYDFITATEVIEHLGRPTETLEQIWACVIPGGYFGIMTKLVLNRDAFSTWHYKNDLTHIAFYSLPTFQWLAGHWQCDFQQVADDAFIFQK